MRNSLVLRCGAALALMACANASAQDSNRSHHDRGWFWYEDPVPAPVSRKPSRSTLTAPSTEREKPLTAKWLQENLEKYRFAAIDDPGSQSKVRLYMYLQKLAIDKSHAFARAVKLAVYNDPQLDEAQRVGANTQARSARTVAAREATGSLMRDIAGKAGLWLFFRSDCPYCHAQIPVLHALENLYGFKVLPISLDGLPLPGGEYPNWVQDSGQARQLHVEATPTLFLVAPPDKILPIASGVVAVDQIEDRVVELGHQAGWLTDNEYATTRDGVGAVNGVAGAEFLQDGLPADLDGIPDNPEILLSLLTAAARAGGKTTLRAEHAISPEEGTVP